MPAIVAHGLGDLVTTRSSSIVCSDVSFAWPDGGCVLDHVDVPFGVGLTGLIGRNGDVGVQRWWEVHELSLPAELRNEGSQ
jgi:hypothetical protein